MYFISQSHSKPNFDPSKGSFKWLGTLVFYKVKRYIIWIDIFHLLLCYNLKYNFWIFFILTMVKKQQTAFNYIKCMFTMGGCCGVLDLENIHT